MLKRNDGKLSRSVLRGGVGGNVGFLLYKLANNFPNPWEKWLPEFKSNREEKSPSQVQKDFGRIIGEIGTPAKPPKPRKKSYGRRKGEIQIKRPRHEVVYKDKKLRYQSTA